MIVKQKNLRVFHISIDDNASFFEYFIKNRVLLAEFFLLIDGKVDKEVKDFLDEAGICYKFIDGCNLRLGSVKKEFETKIEEKPKTEFKTESMDLAIKPGKLKVFDRPIRSGEEINEELPVVVFGRINSGAKLFCTQSVSIYGIIDGLVQCDGDYIVLGGIGNRGSLIFNGEIIDKEQLKENILQKITFDGLRVHIKEVCL
jgi:septum site-determining protein MinC